MDYSVKLNLKRGKKSPECLNVPKGLLYCLEYFLSLLLFFFFVEHPQ